MLIVSLTDSRVDLLKKTIISLFYQTIQPDIIQVFYSSNIKVDELEYKLQLDNIYKIPLYFRLKPNLQTYKNADILMIDCDCEYETTFIEMYMKHSEVYILKDRIPLGTDVKILQYETYAIDRCSTTIDLVNSLNQTDTNVIMINMEKDKIRYDSCIEEFKKISLKTYVHLKSTYYKEQEKLLNDMIYILDFLNIDSNISVNNFSEFSDPNIHIQDGPLACYCAHVIALIYGFNNFKEYTVIVEDDILISNTKKIEEYIKQIPDDWDIICLNSCALNENYGHEPFYKFRNTFHSLHFYIVKNTCLPLIFENVYPIVDQIDVLIAKLHDRLNIYNIVDTVYQKNFATNTQNNLHVIFNSPNYQPIRNYIKEFEEELLNYINQKLFNNQDNNIMIKDSIMYDVVYNYIIEKNLFVTENIKNELVNNTILYKKLFIFINSCVKGINIDNVVIRLLNDINFIINCFELHSDTSKAYRYGSTANTYKCGDVITKVYNQTLRWTHNEHNDITEIFNKEVFILQKLNRITDITENSFSMKYLGESLYTNFILPSDWREQIKNIFEELSQHDIQYPEFNIKNILVLDDGKISFIDFGLARQGTDNIENCKIFIELLELLSIRYNGKKELYCIFINNFKTNNKYPNNIF